MTTPQRVLSIAASRIGYYAPDDPLPGSEAGRYVADLWASYPNAAAAHADGCANWEGGASWLKGSSSSIWWCCLFVSMCYHMAGGRNMPGMPNYNCDNLKSKARSHILGNKRDAAPGDFVLYDWGGDGSCDHIGIVERNAGSYVQAIEGNTSGSNGGSQSSGNGVWRRTRNWSTVNCVIRPVYTGDDDMPLNDADLNNIWNFNGNGGKLDGILNQINNLTNAINAKTDTRIPISVLGAKMTRLYYKPTGAHRFSSSPDEIAMLESQGWMREGDTFSGPSAIGVYGLVNPSNGDCVLTTNPDEARNVLDKAGWESRGIVMLANPEGEGVPIYRLYNSEGGQHMYTIQENEKDALLKMGWHLENNGGPAFWVNA